MERALDWSVGSATPAEIDRLNILVATETAMRRAVEGLAAPPDHLLVDGNRLFDPAAPHTPIVKGDSISQSIAAASILAKVTRDRLMVELALVHPEYGFDRHKGYLSAEHKEALEKHGLCPEHRRSFAPAAKLAQQSLPFWAEEGPPCPDEEDPKETGRRPEAADSA